MSFTTRKKKRKWKIARWNSDQWSNMRTHFLKLSSGTLLDNLSDTVAHFGFKLYTVFTLVLCSKSVKNNIHSLSKALF